MAAKLSDTPSLALSVVSLYWFATGSAKAPLPRKTLAMPLDDREQRILAEIERQFYEDDPELAKAVKNIDRSRGFGIRLPLLGLIGGLAIVVAFFTSQTFVALAGFTVMVLSATALVQEIRRRGWGLEERGADDEERPAWPRWPFGRR